MRQFFLPVLFFCAAMQTSCSSTQPTGSGGSETLYQFQWNLAELNGKAVNLSMLPNMSFTPGQVNRVSGSTGCNRFTGIFETGKSNFIKFLPLAVTKMACAGENVEADLLAAFNKANNFSIANNKLSLNNGGVTLATFNGVSVSNNNAIKLNGSWELSYITGPRIAFDGLYPGNKPQLNFAIPSTTVNGNTSCNSFTSVITTNGNMISFADPRATKMACQGVGEATFLKLLKEVNQFSFDNENTLVLSRETIPLMRFTKK